TASSQARGMSRAHMEWCAHRPLAWPNTQFAPELPGRSTADIEKVGTVLPQGVPDVVTSGEFRRGSPDRLIADDPDVVFPGRGRDHAGCDVGKNRTHGFGLVEAGQEPGPDAEQSPGRPHGQRGVTQQAGAWSRTWIKGDGPPVAVDRLTARGQSPHREDVA